MPRRFEYVYGPVPSRRLGFSLGVDLVPMKTCTYDCIYCQLGRTPRKTCQRREYAPVADVLGEVREALRSRVRPDYVTLSGSGEPTLHESLGRLIAGIRSITTIPAAIITNGSLLWDPEVQDGLKGADLVVPSLDAGTPDLFEYVNRPHPAISFEQMLEGLIRFRERFKQQLWLEVMLLGGVTSGKKEVGAIASCAKRIRPDRIQVNTVVRPPAETYATSIPSDRLSQLARMFTPEAEVITRFRQERHGEVVSVDTPAILALLSRRPCTSEDVATGLGVHVTEALKRLELLISAGTVSTVVTGARNFYTVSGSERDCKQEIATSVSEDVERYLQSCRTEFWQGVFRAELAYIVQHLAGGGEVLSVGCGPAMLESALSERGFRVTGLDVSREALDCAPDSVRTVASRAENMPFPESSFDAVIYVASVQFIGNYRKAIEKTTRVLRPKGTLLVMLLNPESDFFKGKLRDPNSYVRKIRHTSLREIEDVIAENYSVQTEYFLGVKGDVLFESRDITDAVLYVIRGTRKPIMKDKDA
jgi:wyosine [tRNA(Phe)-imidazoG37] synthetase (radical SAM superfamily)/ubiquinone/menaquinone biosynthesis C-methylase UbiE